MSRKFIILGSGEGDSPRRRPPSREDYFITSKPAERHGRLGYGGQRQKLVGCEILEYSETGAHVETYAPVEGKPRFFTLECSGQYHRARLLLAEGRRLRLEFVPEALDYIETE